MQRTSLGLIALAGSFLAVVGSGLVERAIKSLADLRPYLSNQWWEYANTYGFRRKHGSPGQEPYPKSAPLASRRAGVLAAHATVGAQHTQLQRAESVLKTTEVDLEALLAALRERLG